MDKAKQLLGIGGGGSGGAGGGGRGGDSAYGQTGQGRQENGAEAGALAGTHTLSNTSNANFKTATKYDPKTDSQRNMTA